MSKTFSKISTAWLVGLLAFVVAGCGFFGSDTAEPSDTASGPIYDTVTAGKLTIATGEPAYEPWVVNDDPASCQGFEAAIGCEIAKRLGYALSEVIWVRTGFDEAIAPGPKSFDFNLQQYTATDERRQAVDFSSDYAHFPQAMIVYSDGKFAAGTQISDFTEIKIAVANATTSAEWARSFFGEDAVLVFNDVDAAVQAMKSNAADALITDVASAWYISTAELEGTKIQGILEGTQDEGCAALLAKDSPMTAAVTQVIDEMNDDGTIEQLQKTWLYDSSNVAVIAK
jgi:polar amino acid transport system substrate-binding protein